MSWSSRDETVKRLGGAEGVSLEGVGDDIVAEENGEDVNVTLVWREVAPRVETVRLSFAVIGLAGEGFRLSKDDPRVR